MTLMAHHTLAVWWAFGLAEAAACVLLVIGFVAYVKEAARNIAAQEQQREEES